MVRRKKNPVHSSRRKFRYVVENGIRIPTKDVRGKLNKRERKEFLRTVEYMDRVEKMRPFFGELFKPSNGYNLHEVDQWTPTMKRKVTNYFRIVAPRLEGGDFVVKRYRRKDHLDEAIAASLQEKPLKGQKAAIFTVPKGVEKIDVRFTKTRGAVVRQEGIATRSLLFNKKSFLEDWKAEVNRVLDSVPDVRIFKIIKGANLSSDTFTRTQILKEIAAIMELYSEELSEAEGFHQRWFGEWLNGLKAYEGVTISQMRAADRRHKKEVQAREKERNRERRKVRKRIAGRKLKEQLDAQRGRALKKGELATGRRGRVK